MFHIAPEDLVAWLLQGTAEFAGLANTELERQQVFSDMLCHVTVGGTRALLHVKFQKKRDSLIAERLWEYNVQATMEYDRPVRSFVIYPTKDRTVREPYRQTFPNNVLLHRFHFDVLKLWEIPTEELLKMGRLGVLPLLPLTREGQRREVVEQAIELLMPSEEAPQRELLSLLYGFASLAFENDDQEWLHGRFSMLYDILCEAPAFREIAKMGRNGGIEQGRAEALKNLRQVAVDLIATRFASATLTELAQEALASRDDTEQLQRLIITLAVVQTPEEARQMLTGSR
jgi:hypothetical protein